MTDDGPEWVTTWREDVSRRGRWTTRSKGSLELTKERRRGKGKGLFDSFDRGLFVQKPQPRISVSNFYLLPRDLTIELVVPTMSRDTIV